MTYSQPQPLGSWAMVRLFLRLKFRLLRNVLLTKARWGLVVFTLASVGLGTALAFFISDLGPSERVTAGPLVGGAMAAIWLVGPLLFGASDETVDTTRLSLLSLEPRPLAAGMAAASVIGPGPLAGAIPLAALAMQAPGIAGKALALMGALLSITLATTVSRLGLTYLGSTLRNRKSKDFSTLVAGLLAGAVGAGFQVFSIYGVDIGADQLKSIAAVVSLTPFGWGGDAIGRASAGQIAIPLVELTATAALIAVVLRGWVDVLERVLSESDGGDSQRTQDNHLLGESTSRFPWMKRPIWIVLTKERRYLARHPRYRVQLVSQLTVLVVGGAPFLAAVIDRDPQSVLLGCIPGLTAGATGSNLLGPDGPALWGELLASPSFKPLLRGRSLLFTAMGMAAASFVTLAAAIWTGGWRYAPVAILCAAGMALVGSGAGAVTSVLVPTPMSDDDSANPFSTDTPGSGCLNGLVTIVGVFLGFGLAIPILAAVAFISQGNATLGYAIAFASPFYGLAIWVAGTAFAAHKARQRIPELVEALSITR